MELETPNADFGALLQKLVVLDQALEELSVRECSSPSPQSFAGGIRGCHRRSDGLETSCGRVAARNDHRERSSILLNSNVFLCCRG